MKVRKSVRRSFWDAGQVFPSPGGHCPAREPEEQPMKESSSSSSIRLGGAVISDRIVAALLENYQTPEGIRIPEALIPYTGFDIIK